MQHYQHQVVQVFRRDGTELSAIIDRMEQFTQGKKQMLGLSTGFNYLDNMTCGLKAGEYYVFAARPGMGKTSLATNIAFNAAARWMRDMQDGIPPEKSVGAPVAFFSLEMSADQLATRILSEQSRIVAEDIRTGKMNAEKFRDFARSARDLESLPLYIDDTPGLTIAALRTRARRMKRRHQIGLIIGSGGKTINEIRDVTHVEDITIEDDGSVFITGKNEAKQTIAMTTPVLMRNSATNSTMAFVLPAKLGRGEVPRPEDAAVEVTAVTAGRFAVWRFSGGRIVGGGLRGRSRTSGAPRTRRTAACAPGRRSAHAGSASGAHRPCTWPVCA